MRRSALALSLLPTLSASPLVESRPEGGKDEPALALAVLRPSDVVFMYASSPEAYKAYGATFVAWRGANTIVAPLIPAF